MVESTKALDGNSKGAGVMIKPDNDHVYTVGVHTYNNCENFDCGNYKVHCHVSQLVNSSTCSNPGYEFKSIPGSIHDLDKSYTTCKSGQDKTISSLTNIDVTQRIGRPRTGMQ